MKTAILIPCYNRPHYLEQILTDVLAIPQVRMGTPVVLACDGGDSATAVKNIELAVKTRIPVLHSLIRPEHFGIGRNVYEAKRYLFEDCHYDRVFYLEDDIRVTPHVLTLLQNLLHWLEANYDNASIVSTSIFCNMPLEQKRAALTTVSDCGYSLANHLMTKECWHLTRPWLAEYVNNFLQCPYTSRDTARIREWMRRLAQRLPIERGNRMFPVYWPFKEYFMGTPACSQDNAMALAVRLAGFSHVVTHVNRALHIGKQGVNSNEKQWERDYAATALDVFEEDNIQTCFRLR